MHSTLGPKGRIRAAIDELYALKNRKGSGSGGLIATYSAQNAADVTLNDSTPTTIASVAGVVVGAGQKVIISANAMYSNQADAVQGAIQRVSYSGSGTPIDIVESDNMPAFSSSAKSLVIARTFEFAPAAGTYTFTLAGLCTSAAPGGVTVPGAATSGALIGGGQLTIQVVSD